MRAPRCLWMRFRWGSLGWPREPLIMWPAAPSYTRPVPVLPCCGSPPWRETTVPSWGTHVAMDPNAELQDHLVPNQDKADIGHPLAGCCRNNKPATSLEHLPDTYVRAVCMVTCAVCCPWLRTPPPMSTHFLSVPGNCCHNTHMFTDKRTQRHMHTSRANAHICTWSHDHMASPRSRLHHGFHGPSSLLPSWAPFSVKNKTKPNRNYMQQLLKLKNKVRHWRLHP
jgi:hypothetical protein